MIVWRTQWNQEASEERAKSIMRRVGARMMKKDVVFAVTAWKDNTNKGVLEMVIAAHRLEKLCNCCELTVEAKGGKVAAYCTGAGSKAGDGRTGQAENVHACCK